MERLVLQQLIEWKNRRSRKSLILNGARQVGKTWILREFARREYRKEAYLLCRKNDIAEQIFKQDFDVDRILRSLRALTGVDITSGDTLIILDEVQEIPEAIESLKYFCEQLPDYHIAVAGSLLGISLHRGVSYPVGKVNFSEYKGGMTENYVLQQMKSKGVAPIYYHKAENSRLELDFVIQKGEKVLPIEVKAEENVRANSLTTLLSRQPDLTAVRYSMLPYRRQGQMECLPLYAI